MSIMTVTPDGSLFLRGGEVLEFACVVDPFEIDPGVLVEAIYTVNATPFFGAAPGTTRLDSVTINREVTDDGESRTVVRYCYEGDSHGWNNWLRPDRTWGEVTFKAGEPLHRPFDFSRLPLGPYAGDGRPKVEPDGLWPDVPEEPAPSP